MTREKAIEYNKNLRMYMKISDKNTPCKFLEENHIALDMAIKSLETLQDITVLFDQWTSGELNDGQYHFQMQNLILFGKTLAEVSDKALEKEPCEDAVSRSDMLDAIGHGTTYTSEDLQRIIKVLPPVTPQPKTGK